MPAYTQQSNYQQSYGHPITQPYGQGANQPTVQAYGTSVGQPAYKTNPVHFGNTPASGNLLSGTSNFQPSYQIPGRYV